MYGGCEFEPWLGSRDATCLKTKKPNQEEKEKHNTVTDSIKTLKRVHIHTHKTSFKKWELTTDSGNIKHFIREGYEKCSAYNIETVARLNTSVKIHSSKADTQRNGKYNILQPQTRENL